MGRLRGFGENQYYRYELGEVPSPSNGRLMRTLIDNRTALVCAIKEISRSCTESSMKSMKLTLRSLISGLSLHVTRVYSMRMR